METRGPGITRAVIRFTARSSVSSVSSFLASLLLQLRDATDFLLFDIGGGGRANTLPLSTPLSRSPKVCLNIVPP